MNKKKIIQKMLPHTIAILIFYVLTLIFFRETLFNEKQINQHDIQQYRNSARELNEFNANKPLSEQSLWTNSMFSGMPSYLISIKWYNDIVMALYEYYGMGLSHPVRIFIFSLLSFYILLLSFKIRPYIAIIGAIGFTFSSYNVIGFFGGHNSRIGAIAFVPLVLAGLHFAYQKKIWMGVAITSVAMALHIAFAHIQITYYLLFIVLTYCIVEFFIFLSRKQLFLFLKISILLLIGACIGLGTSAGKLFTIYEYNKYSIRGKAELQEQIQERRTGEGLDKEYAFQYSNGIIEPIVLFIPNILGGSSQQSLDKKSYLGKKMKEYEIPDSQANALLENAPTYWGNQPLTAPYYSGCIFIFLFVLGFVSHISLKNQVDYKKEYLDKGFFHFFFEKTQRVYFLWMFFMILAGIMLSWGSNFYLNSLLFDYLPGYNKFRSPTFTMLIPIFFFILGGCIALEEVFLASFQQNWRKIEKKQIRNLLLAVLLTAGFALLLLCIGILFSYTGKVDTQLAENEYPKWFLEALILDRKYLFRMDAFRTIFYILLSACVIFFLWRKKITIQVATLSITTLVVFDVLLVADRFVKKDSFTSNAPVITPDANKKILLDSSYYRVLYLPNPFNDANTSYYHHSIGGYSAAKLRRYQDLIEHCLSREYARCIGIIRTQEYNFTSLPVINMLNTKYFQMGEEYKDVIKNNNANGPVWFVKKLVPVTTPDEEMKTLCTIDTKTTAVIDVNKYPILQTEYDTTGNISFQKYQPNKITYISSTSEKRFAVFSEIYYPEGWKAKIDDQEIPIMRVNYVLRALEIPQGEHTITFTFESDSYLQGNTIMKIFSWILLGTLLSGLGYEIYKTSLIFHENKENTSEKNMKWKKKKILDTST
ncbi:MAG: YfhO family protein [Chitinophagaceae bacterium]|nr:YfhO family protein [Chitinophagaceae bacterium]